MVTFNIWDLNLSDIDHGIHKHAIETNRSFQRFWKKIITQKWKKKPILVYPWLRYAHKKN